MSHTPTISQPPEPLRPTASRPPPPPEALAAIEGTVRRLRAELAATADPTRHARLLAAIAEAEERAGDEPAAARDYLAAFNADPEFREPLEGLVRLLEKRRSLKNLGRLVGALTRSAGTPDEKVRALIMSAAYHADVAQDFAAAKGEALEAAQVEGASTAEQASAWLALELAAGRTGDAETRAEALAHRSQIASNPTWRALLLADRARLAAAAGEIDRALPLAEEARSLASAGTWAAASLLEQLARENPGEPGTDEARARANVHADALDAVAGLVEEATADAARGDALGVPRWARQPARLVDAWLRAAEARRLLGQLDRAAATLDRALERIDALEGGAGGEGSLAAAAVATTRIRVAEQTGDTGLAAKLAERRLATEKDGGLAAALALRVAEHAAAEGDGARATEALARAIGADPGCLPARALQLDVLADGGDASAFAAQLESFADHLATDEARSRAFLLAAFVWAVRASDVAGAKAALSQASMFGVAPATTARVARMLAAIAGDNAWYEEATRRLVAAATGEGEAASLYVELVRARHARNDAEGAAKALRDMAGAPKGAWLAHVLEAFLPSGRNAGPAPVEQLAALETDPALARGLGLVAAVRAAGSGEAEHARKLLRELAGRDASDPLVAAFLADLERAAGDHAAAARVASDAAAAVTGDPELAAALRLEAGFERWRAGDRKPALEEMEAAQAGAPEAAKMVLAWASRGVDPDTVAGRRRALEHADAHGSADAAVLALERFATEVGGGDPDEAAGALASAERSAQGAVATAAAIARLAWSAGATDPNALADAIAWLGQAGPKARELAAAEQVRLAREANDAEEAARAASRWSQAGGGLPAAIEWLAATTTLGHPDEQKKARLAVAASLSGEAREAMLASAALLDLRAHPERPVPLVAGSSAAVRLANLELAAPGCDPRRRARALAAVDAALGNDAAVDAASLAGWPALVASDLESARAAFEKATRVRPADLAAWEGLRACGEQLGDKALQARAAAELGARCRDAERGAAFSEEAALLFLEVGEDAMADAALEAGFARDPKRAVAFDKLFRRVRDRKDNDRLLGLVERRLAIAEDPQEIQKLYWEQARVLREKGDQDGALSALEHVTMLDPDHVGALALLGEINIRRSNFEQAAESLGRLASLPAAPAKNRVTAGVAAVDLYEKKLDRFDKALEVLLILHKAKLSTLPVRERLARAAARTGSWKQATAILEHLMHERPEAEGRIEAARLAMAIHRDRLENPQGAAAAIVKLLEESPTDGEAIDMLLQTDHPRDVRGRLLDAARSGLVEALQRRPGDVASLRRLVKIARAQGDDALQQAALGALTTLGGADAQAAGALAQIASAKPRAPQIAIAESMLRSILAPGDEGPVAELFVLLGPTLAEALGPSLQACGVGKRDRVDPRSGLALRNEIAAWAGAFGIREFDLYVGGHDAEAVQGIPGEPPALVVGTGIHAPLSGAARARGARELLGIVRGSTVTRTRDDITVASVVVAACREAEIAVDRPPYAMLAEVERLLGKALARKTRKALPDVCRAIVAQRADARAWSRRALASLDRVAAVASGDPGVVLAEVLGVAHEKLGAAVKGNARAEELLRFVLSPQYLDIRRALGLEGGA